MAEQKTVYLSELSDEEIKRIMGWDQRRVDEYRAIVASDGKSPDVMVEGEAPPAPPEPPRAARG